MMINLSAYSEKVTKKDVFKYLKQNGGILSFIIKPESILSVILVIAYLIYSLLFNSVKFVDSIGFIVVCVVSLFSFSLILYILFVEMMKVRVLLTRFANDNGLKYYPIGKFSVNKAGFLFNIGHSRRYIDVLSSNSQEDGFEIANYKYTVGSGKNKKVVTAGYISVKLDRKLPHMILDSVKNNYNFFGVSFSNLPINIDRSQFLSLEGDFDSYFKLYAPKNYEADALYIFNPALMQKFIGSVNGYDAEIVDDYLFIYSLNKFDFTKKQTLVELFNIIETVMGQTKRASRYYRDEKATADFKENIISKSGLRLKKKNSLDVVIVAVMIIIVIVLQVLNF